MNMNTTSDQLTELTRQLFANKTIVTDGIWPDVTCHNLNFSHWSPPAFIPPTISYNTAGPVDSTSWPRILQCCPGNNITIEDSGSGCSAGCWSLPTQPGAVYRCLLDAGFQDLGCVGDPEFSCKKDGLSRPAISSYLATVTASRSASATSTSISSSTSSTSPRPTSAANSVRGGTSVKLAAVVVVGLLASTLL